jgi:hypothetical protein
MHYAEQMIRDALTAIDDGTVTIDGNYRQDLKSLLSRLGTGEVAGLEGLRQFLASHQDVARAIGTVLAKKALLFVDDELNKYTELKTTRPLTGAEIRYGREQLVPLLRAVVDLCVRRPQINQ